MRVFAGAAIVALFALLSAAEAGARPFAPCPDTHWCRAVEILENAVYVYPAHGTFHLRAGRYDAPGLTVWFMDRPGLIAIDGPRAAVISSFRGRTPQAQLYIHLFVRTSNGFFEDVATAQLGPIRPMNLTLHAGRLRVNSLDARGREITTVYHLSAHGLHAAATRHAQ